MAAHQAPPSLGFSRQEHWSGLPFPSPMHESEKSKWSCSVVSDSSRPHGLQPTRLLRPWDFPGKSTGVGWSGVLQNEKRFLRGRKKSLRHRMCVWLWEGIQSHTRAKQAFLMQVSPILWGSWEQFPSWHTIADMGSKAWRQQWAQCTGYIFLSGASVPKTPSFSNAEEWWQPSLQAGEAENTEKSRFSKIETVIIHIKLGN